MHVCYPFKGHVCMCGVADVRQASWGLHTQQWTGVYTRSSGQGSGFPAGIGPTRAVSTQVTVVYTPYTQYVCVYLCVCVCVCVWTVDQPCTTHRRAPTRTQSTPVQYAGGKPTEIFAKNFLVHKKSNTNTNKKLKLKLKLKLNKS